MRILIIEDNKSLNDAISEILLEKKYLVDSVYDGSDGLSYGLSGIYDCIILDIMLPRLNGFEVLKRLREERISTPVLMLTAKDSIKDKVKGLDMGADDYMTKPFSTEELLARIRTLCRRKGEVVLNTLEFEDLCFSLDSVCLSSKISGKEIRLTFKEAEIIKLFLSRPQVIISKEEIIIKVWGYDSEAGDNSVETYISFIRKKLLFVGSACEIVSIKKLGYRLIKND
ncbi:MAG: response regulator transcription factor [Clostridia bacterium]|nr:response regulator transcription factor [Clostridia bacterium]